MGIVVVFHFFLPKKKKKTGQSARKTANFKRQPPLTTMECASCTFENPSDKKKCGVCSAPLLVKKELVNCPACTLENPAASKNCSVCDCPLSVSSPGSGKRVNEASRDQDKKQKKEGESIASSLNLKPEPKKAKKEEKEEKMGVDAGIKEEKKGKTPVSLLFEQLRCPEWRKELREEFGKPYISKLEAFLREQELAGKKIFPPLGLVFDALNRCPLSKVKVVMLGQVGNSLFPFFPFFFLFFLIFSFFMYFLTFPFAKQDPYHGPNQAHGLCFSVQKGVPIPPSLRNMYKELTTDIEGFKAPRHGNLNKWANQGILLLNTTLSVYFLLCFFPSLSSSLSDSPMRRSKKQNQNPMQEKDGKPSQKKSSPSSTRSVKTLFFSSGGHTRKQKGSLSPKRNTMFSRARTLPLSQPTMVGLDANIFRKRTPFSRASRSNRLIGFLID